MTITFTGSDDKFTVYSEPKIIFYKAVVFSRGGKEIGYIDAEYDFSNLPAEYHELAIKTLQRQGMNVRICF